MNTTQKALALNALGGFSIKIRSSGDWYASVSAEIKRGVFLESPAVSEATPNKAVDSLFKIYTDLGVHVVLNAYGKDRREVRWNGFMWEDMT